MSITREDMGRFSKTAGVFFGLWLIAAFVPIIVVFTSRSVLSPSLAWLLMIFSLLFFFKPVVLFSWVVVGLIYSWFSRRLKLWARVLGAITLMAAVMGFIFAGYLTCGLPNLDLP